MATAGLAASEKTRPAQTIARIAPTQHVVDGEPPFGDAAAVGARDPHAARPVSAMPGSAATRARNASPRTSKLRYWSNEAQAGDSSTTGSGAAARGCVARGGRGRRIECTAALEWNVAIERGREFLRRLSDKVGLGEARKERGEARDTARLRLAAKDPVNVARKG